PGYWARHLRQTVRFSDGLAQISGAQGTVLLEVGPSNSLSMVVRQGQAREEGVVSVQTMPHPQEPRSGQEGWQQALGRLWIAGVEVDWNSITGEPGRRVPLPGYAFDRQKFWVDPGRGNNRQARAEEKRRERSEWFYVPSWKRNHELERSPQAGEL